MTPQQQKCLDFIRQYVAEHSGVSPSYEEIAPALGIVSKSGVHRVVYALLQRGYLYKEPGHARRLRPVPVSESPHDGPVLAAALTVAAAYDRHCGPTPEDIRQLVQAYRRRERKLEVVA